MVKKYKIILSLLLVVLTAFTAVTVTGVIDINKMVDEMKGNNDNDVPKNTYEDIFSTYTKAGLPLLKTDVEDVFYTMDTEGNVAFYKAGTGTVEKLPETGTFDVEVDCSGQILPAKIHYLTTGGKTLGYGLFTNIDHPEVYLYEYAFFKVTDQFDAYDSKSELLLLIDVDKSRFYSEDKVFSESFYLYSDNKTAVFLNEDQRIVDLTAKLKTDYKMFTDDILHQEEGKILFFSSRFYNDYSYSDKTDIFISGGSGENVDNNRYILDVASLNFWRTKDGTRYFAVKSEENGEAEGTAEAPASFVLMNKGDGATEEIASFEGSLKEDYLLCDNYLLSKKSGEIYDVLTDKTVKLDYSPVAKTFTPDIFTMSENGKYCVLRGRNSLNKPSIAVVDFENNKTLAFTDNVFGYVASLQMLNDGTAVISLAAGENSSTYYQLVYSCKDGASSVPGTTDDAIVG